MRGSLFRLLLAIHAVRIVAGQDTSPTPIASPASTPQASDQLGGPLQLAQVLLGLATPICNTIDKPCGQFNASLISCQADDSTCACKLTLQAQRCTECMIDAVVVQQYNAFLGSCVNASLASPSTTITLDPTKPTSAPIGSTQSGSSTSESSDTLTIDPSHSPPGGAGSPSPSSQSPRPQADTPASSPPQGQPPSPPLPPALDQASAPTPAPAPAPPSQPAPAPAPPPASSPFTQVGAGDRPAAGNPADNAPISPQSPPPRPPPPDIPADPATAMAGPAGSVATPGPGSTPAAAPSVAVAVPVPSNQASPGQALPATPGSANADTKPLPGPSASLSPLSANSTNLLSIPSPGANSSNTSNSSSVATNLTSVIPLTLALNATKAFFNSTVPAECSNLCQSWKGLSTRCADDICICSSAAMSGASSCQSCVGGELTGEQRSTLMTLYSNYTNGCSAVSSGSGTSGGSSGKGSNGPEVVPSATLRNGSASPSKPLTTNTVTATAAAAGESVIVTSSGGKVVGVSTRWVGGLMTVLGLVVGVAVV